MSDVTPVLRHWMLYPSTDSLVGPKIDVVTEVVAIEDVYRALAVAPPHEVDETDAAGVADYLRRALNAS